MKLVSILPNHGGQIKPVAHYSSLLSSQVFALFLCSLGLMQSSALPAPDSVDEIQDPFLRELVKEIIDLDRNVDLEDGDEDLLDEQEEDDLADDEDDLQPVEEVETPTMLLGP